MMAGWTPTSLHIAGVAETDIAYTQSNLCCQDACLAHQAQIIDLQAID
jgi:hypothetical protein